MSGEGGVVTNVGEPASVGLDVTPEPLAHVIVAARRRLGWLGVRAEIARHAALVCAAAAVGAAGRPFLWPVAHPVDPWRVVVRAIALGLAFASIALAIVAARSWRRRPSLLASARRLDDARGLAEVIASGFAFERDLRADEMACFAVERARAAVRGIDLERLLVPSSQVRSRRENRWLLGAGGAVLLGLAVGGIDRVLVERVLDPVTDREAAAAAALRKAAEEVAANAPQGASDEKKMLAPRPPAAEELVEAARRASEAAQRGDRRSALEALDGMRKASRALEADEREQARSLRSLRDELEGASAAAKGKAADDASGKEAAGRPSRASTSDRATASEALANLKRDLDSAAGDKESLRKMIERLEHAEAAARAAAARSAGKDASGKKDTSGKGQDGKSKAVQGTREAAWSRAAAALAEAREAAARGDKEAASRAMERAEREISALEKASREAASASRMARVADEASELDRAMHAALKGDRSSGRGSDGRDGRDGVSGKEGAGASRATSKDNGDPSGAPGVGPGAGDRAPGREQRRAAVGGDLQARADVREGERAVSAIEGMGRGGDPRAFREIFPSYDTVVEDGLREDSVPAARRPIVRRYFSSIRPGGDEETRNRP